MKMLKKILKIAGIALLILISVPLLIGQILRLTANVEEPPGEMVDVGGYKLHIDCVEPEGTATENLPTVIFEAGAGVSSSLNYWIKNGISQTTKVCVYDRAGLGWSEESNLPRDAKTINTALHTLLDKSNIKRPFVFAGHSIAGIYMRDYVERYPDEVLGLVFLDPSHPEQNERLGFSKVQRAEQLDSLRSQLFTAKLMMRLGIMEVLDSTNEGDVRLYPENIRRQLSYLSKKPTHLDAFMLELGDFENAARQAGQNKSLGDRPIVVISALKLPTPDVLPEGVLPQEIHGNLMKMHKEITELSTNGKRVEIENADHMSLIISNENVVKVVPYIIQVVRESADILKSKQANAKQTE